MLTALILATAIQSLPQCKDVLNEYQAMLKDWSAARRTVTEVSEEHRYHTVSKAGVTTTIVLRAAVKGSDAYEDLTFKKSADCLFNGNQAAIYFKVSYK